jgi:polyhydroxyalkanoate synthesis regulator phasin
MSRKAVSALALAAVGGLLLVVAGCGGGGGGDKAAAETHPATTTAPAAATTTEEHTSTSAAVPNFASAGNCKELAEVGQKLSAAMTANGGKLNTEQTAKFFEEFADKTPQAIRGDFKVIAAAYVKIAKALEGVDLSSGKAPDPQAIAKLQKVASEIDQASVTKAETHIASWVQTNCTQK